MTHWFAPEIELNPWDWKCAVDWEQPQKDGMSTAMMAEKNNPWDESHWKLIDKNNEIIYGPSIGPSLSNQY